jgi:hypothetical protein
MACQYPTIRRAFVQCDSGRNGPLSLGSSTRHKSLRPFRKPHHGQGGSRIVHLRHPSHFLCCIRDLDRHMCAETDLPCARLIFF